MTTENAQSPENPYAAPQPPDANQGQNQLLTTPIDPTHAIVAEGVVTEEEFFAAQKLHRSSRRTTDIVWGVLLILFASGGVKLLMSGSSRAVIVVVLLIVAVHLIMWRLVFPRIAARRVWQRSRSLHSPMRRLITPELVQTITIDSNVTVRWSAYVKYRSSDQVVLFYLAEHPQLFTLFARGMFASEEDWQQFQQLVQEQLPEA